MFLSSINVSIDEINIQKRNTMDIYANFHPLKLIFVLSYGELLKINNSWSNESRLNTYIAKKKAK